MRPRMYVMQGLPGSGKSTRAAELSLEAGAEIVNRDNLRMALHGTYWSGDISKEEEVTHFERSLVIDNLKRRNSVIIDATHLNPERIHEWAQVAEQFQADMVIIPMTADVDTCISRDEARAARGERAVGAEVIRRMGRMWTPS